MAGVAYVGCGVDFGKVSRAHFGMENAAEVGEHIVVQSMGMAVLKLEKVANNLDLGDLGAADMRRVGEVVLVEVASAAEVPYMGLAVA